MLEHSKSAFHRRGVRGGVSLRVRVGSRMVVVVVVVVEASCEVVRSKSKSNSEYQALVRVLFQ